MFCRIKSGKGRLRVVNWIAHFFLSIKNLDQNFISQLVNEKKKQLSFFSSHTPYLCISLHLEAAKL